MRRKLSAFRRQSLTVMVTHERDVSIVTRSIALADGMILAPESQARARELEVSHA